MNINDPLVLFGVQNLTTTPLELIAVILTIICVFGASRLKVMLQYPVGILGTICYFFVFKDAGLLSSAALQVYFTAIQLYGWWYWLYGAKTEVSGRTIRHRPGIGNWNWSIVFGLGLVAIVVSTIISSIVNSFFDAQAVFWDSMILSLSVLAQFLLDRKQIKTWFVWGAVNVLSIYVYGITQGLWVSGILYCALLVNVFYGYYNWNRVATVSRAEGKTI